MPHNVTTSKRYQGINVIQLMVSAMAGAYPTAEWATFKQWSAIGASVKKGEKGTLVVYWDTFKDKNDPDKTRFFIKHSYAFNAAQVDGYEAEKFETVPIPPIEEWLETQGYARYIKPAPGPCYWPHKDRVGIPDITSFTTSEAYYASLLHEFAHWTGHKTRLDRTQTSVEADRKAYALEELVAEMCAAFTGAHFRIDQDQHASYLASWLKSWPAKDRPQQLMTAARLASQAFEYLVEDRSSNVVRLVA